MSELNRILRELREKRLWPVALVLLIAIVAVPVLLSGTSAQTPVAQLPQTGAVGSPPGLPAVSVQATPASSVLSGPARDPFTQQPLPLAGTTPSSTGATPISPSGSAALRSATGESSGGTPATGGGSGGGSGSGTGGGSGSSGSEPGSTTPSGPPSPAPSGLTDTESYDVTFAVTNSAGGLDTIAPLERLSVFPTDEYPLMVELGVLQGGHRVLFAIEPNAAVSGPGTCTPGPLDCEVLSLAQDQIETLSIRSSNGTEAVSQFAVTAIKIDQHSTVAAADAARRMASAAGRQVLSMSNLSALSLFQYEPSIGAVVDERNLTIGGS